MKIPIIALHGIEPFVQEAHDVGVIEFDYLCATLRTNDYETVSFKDLLAYLDCGIPLPRKPVIITSDDGYANLYEQAYPILKDYDFFMTVFLSTAFIGDEERQNNTFDSKVVGIPTRPMLIWEEVREMHKNGIEFLSHSATHRRPEKFTEEEAIFELEHSMQTIQFYLGGEVPFIAWPFNTVYTNAKQLLQYTGYRGAVLYRGGIEDTETIDLFAIKRIPIMGTTPIETYNSLIGEDET
jgi:peptidoglycan/xylan/chitin deacetylase (PgdA/CDA1 family)